MTLKGTSKIYKHPKADTLYITIPAKIAKDSQFPFKNGEIISVEIAFYGVIIRGIDTK